jgi:hypothetical protein
MSCRIVPRWSCTSARDCFILLTQVHLDDVWARNWLYLLAVDPTAEHHGVLN